MADVTRDALFGGRVALAQPTRGYRVNVDAILLAGFAARILGAPARASRARYPRTAVDLGAGVGGVALSLLALGATDRVVLVESDARYASLATENLLANGWSDRGEVLTADVRVAARDLAASADLVVMNPPYVEPGRGRSPAEPRARACFGSLDVFLDAARAVVGRRGRVCIIYPAIETTTLLTGLRARGLEPKRLAMVHGRPQAAARVVLVEAVAGRPGGLVIAPAIVETDGPGVCSPTLAPLLRGEL